LPLGSERQMDVSQSITGWRANDLASSLILFLAAVILCGISLLLLRQLQEYKKFTGTATFGAYLEYKFYHWFASNKSAPAIVLVVLSLGLITSGAIAYSFVVKGTLSNGLYRIFVWASAASADGEGTFMGRTIGIAITVCGIILLSLLLGIVSDTFSSKMAAIRGGDNNVYEGGHTVILGFSTCTAILLENLANARESEGGGVFVVLDPKPRVEVEEALAAADMNMRNSRVIVRSGHPHLVHDLARASVDAASKVVVMSDSSACGEDADAKNAQTLLTLRNVGWPKNGRIVVQGAVEANADLFDEIYPGKVDVVVVGEIIARLMVLSWRQPGLCEVYSQILGFEGDEFYSQEEPDLVGVSFGEAIFLYPDAVPVGVMRKNLECLLNPDWGYKIQDGDRIIVLAEDDDSYAKTEEPYWEPKSAICTPRDVNCVAKRSFASECKVLVAGWNRYIGPILATLDELVPPGTEVDIFSPRSPEERQSYIRKYFENSTEVIDNLKEPINMLKPDIDQVTSFSSVEALFTESHYDGLFVLSDVDLRGDGLAATYAADAGAIAFLTQLQRIRKTVSTEQMDAVVELNFKSTQQTLKCEGYVNLVHSNSLLAQAIASVAEDPSVKQILNKILSTESDANELQIQRYTKFLARGENMPSSLSFGEAMWTIGTRVNAVLVGWSTVDGWEINPKDKCTPRPWSDSDRVVVLAHRKQ